MREIESMSGVREREGGTESEAGSRIRTVSTELHVGLELTDREIMTWAKVGRLTDWATQGPELLFSCTCVSVFTEADTNDETKNRVIRKSELSVNTDEHECF